MTKDANNRSEVVTVVLFCGHRRLWRYGEHPRRNAFVLCLRCDSGAHVKEVVRGRAA